MKKLFFILFLLSICEIGFSQRIFFPRISAELSSQEDSIVLSDLKISVQVVENIATTTFEMRFYNSNGRILEGELNFPLPNGTTVSHFALDVNGEMRDAVVVEKEKATQVFESVIRQNIDPGIVELTKGNNFRARVYPIPPRGYKKAELSFEQELKGDEESYLYQLPLNFKQKLKNFAVHVEVAKSKPVVNKGSHPTINLEFEEEREVYVSDHQESDVLLNSQLAFSIPKVKKLKEVNTYKGKITSDNYFYVNLNLKKEQREKAKPKSVAILWDQSLSANNRDIEKEITFLEQYLNWASTESIRLVGFSNAIHLEQEKIEIEQLSGTLKKLAYDGGTNLHALDFSQYTEDEVLLFTDGISNFGKKTSFQFSSPLLVVNSSNQSNHNLLDYFAASSGGQYLNLLELASEEALEIATHLQKQFIKAEYDKTHIKDFYPKVNQSITNNFGCSGILEGGKHPITLHFGFGKEVTESHTVSIDNSYRQENPIGERIWAQKKLKALLVEDNAEEIKEHGKRFSLVTPTTSLIVLDNVEDYVRYEIIPPASLKDRYDQLIQLDRNKAENGRKDRINQICYALEREYAIWSNTKKVDPREPKPQSIILRDRTETQVEQEASEQYEVIITDSNMELSDANGSFEYLKLAADKSSTSGYSKARTATLNIQKWDSNEAYIGDLKAVDLKDVYSKYLELSAQYTNNPSFYFDVATYLFNKSMKKEGLRVISNLAELDLESAALMRTLGRKLSEFNFHEEAIEVFKEVLEIRSFEPHSYIDLGLEYAELGENQKAIETLYTVIDKAWTIDIINRFKGIELIVIHDINNIINRSTQPLSTQFIEACILKHMPNDVRIVIDWDADNTDIDLWITDPNKEKCSFKNRETRIGGRISNDITRGYGPEEFQLRKAIDGNYKIVAKFYGSTKQTLLGKVTVRAIIYTHFGSENQEKQVLTLQLEPKKEGKFTIGEIAFAGDKK